MMTQTSCFEEVRHFPAGLFEGRVQYWPVPCVDGAAVQQEQANPCWIGGTAEIRLGHLARYVSPNNSSDRPKSA